MSEWAALYRAHRELRAQGREVVTELRRVLRRIGEHNPSVFDAHVHQRLISEKNPVTNIRTVRLKGEREYVATWNLSADDQAEIHLEEAALTVLLSMNASTGHLHELTLMVEAKKRNGAPWTLAIHLPDDRETEKSPTGDRQGHGAGGHAALHCHVGPTLDDQPNVRVPLPPLPPAALLAWLMSQVVPTLPFEPAPWPDVLAALA